ncbi:serine hydrolase domain-containing protein [Sphingomonas alpina]|uniref:Beta-lactamase family protein n=1 Tax=Sphingomonas alpina TaxID=653931 RepID=A0A7H0LG33_9SPHN|nr:serine hydrolase domain-containing protein [Sphingomonas alpina]QNQ08636.1 beta-lactamase family protein [Sphingomonas alpina]
MGVNRRDLLGIAVIGSVAATLPARASGAKTSTKPATLAIRNKAGRDYGEALERLRDYAAAELDAIGLPGMTISVVDADGFTASLSVGWSDVDKRLPVTPGQLFQIGSISKSISGLWLHAAQDKGLIDLSAPVSRYLAGVPLPAQTMTVQQLLNHAGGLAHDAPVFPRTPDGKLWTGFKPGARMSYSNIGYAMLGLIIGNVSGKPHFRALEDDVLKPLGMTGATAHIRTADRDRYAMGYVPIREDGVAMSRAALIPGPWTESDNAAGAVAASADGMAGYLRYLLALGAGKGGPLMSDAAAKKMLADDITSSEFGSDARYASGIATVQIDGKPALHHTGGMTLFSSAFHADPVAGVACFASVNGRLISYRPRLTTIYAIQLMRAVVAGTALPPPPDPIGFRRVPTPERYAGTFVGPEGRSVTLRATGAGLVLADKNGEGRIELSGKDSLATDHPGYAAHQLDFEGAKADRFWWGDTLFGRDAAPPQPIAVAALKPLAGDYSSSDGTFVVLARGGTLVAEGAGEFVRRPGGFWSPKEDVGGVTRVWFDGAVNGVPSRLIFCGMDFIRIT